MPTRSSATTKAYSSLVDWVAYDAQTEDAKLVAASAFGYPGELPEGPEEASILLSNCANAEYSGLVGEPEIGYGLIQAFNYCDRNPHMWSQAVSITLVGVPGDVVTRLRSFLDSVHHQNHQYPPKNMDLGRELLQLRDNVFPSVQDPRTGKTNFLMYEFLTIAAEELVQGGTLKDPSWVLAPLARKLMVAGRTWWESSPVPSGMPPKLQIVGALEYNRGPSRRSIIQKWGGLISGDENHMVSDLQGFGDKPVVKTWKTHYRELSVSRKTDFNWKNGVTKWVSALFLRWH